MEGAYDEIISDNPFFMELRNEYTNLFQHCITQSWIICVPRIGSLNTRVFTIEDFGAHILVPSEELPETHYSTLTEKQVTVNNKVITLELTKGLPLQSHILFEETFYTEDLIKYKVWCIESSLEPTATTSDNVVTKDCLVSINDCIDLLWTQAAGRQVLDQIELNVQIFLKKHPTLPIAIGTLKEAISELYTQCLQTTLQNRRLREKSKASKHILDNIKLAVESYMQHLLFDTLFKSICTSCAYEDSHLNKKIRNMSDIQLRDLEIKKELYHAVPKAKQILSKIDSYNTSLEKILCLKQALNAVNKIDNSNNVVLLTADDLLPVFVFLLIKSGLPTWYSQLTYMKEFRFSGVGRGDGDESSFLITTLEAVIEHIQSGALAGPPDPESHYYESNLTEENLQDNKQRKSSLTESIATSETNCREETLEYVFELIKANHTELVQDILERNQKHLKSIQQNEKSILKIALEETMNNNDLDDEDSNSDTEIYQKLCHPLCNCKKCWFKISKNLLKTSPTTSSRDSHGLTPLHVACIHGKAAIVEILLDMGADVNATDLNECIPLHYAASRGHQNALLLLLHSGANINYPNVDKNTPLHLAVNNGHLNCVKALIYFAEHGRKKMRINCVNEIGNTPLHLASKWGYEGIARLLIENGAEPTLQNKNNKSAFDYAHNLRILHVLKSSTPTLFEYIHITSSDIKKLNCKSDNSEIFKLGKLNFKNRDISNNASKAVENLKRIDRVLQAITYGDIKLACFYLNIDYETNTEDRLASKGPLCHPLCECQFCKKTQPQIADFDINFADTNGFTALHYAARFGMEDLCKILLNNKANVNCVNKKGQNPLHLAAIYNKSNVISLLLDNGANINSIDSAGSTALHNSSDMGNIGATKVLLNYNPDLSLLDGTEKSALDVAKKKVHLTIIDLIEKYASKLDKNK
ncbi:PREDICTED: ankyrin repeat domain-containing protein 27 [Papilio xuthus]|uniref:Ankyrin repeat domain-containing protein 27 n=1 Tax=Papilio xuthus TaxID=66420 RepID=A0AAJ7EAL8_PAPXU|nr:PREDICTED: ankyrin repeat domain-containing protein 27 [Papilio xuthus]XP_013169500.1 PREDICTED: ankyrin repeat domain-containing protein 27 [Papilio xuthus]